MDTTQAADPVEKSDPHSRETSSAGPGGPVDGHLDALCDGTLSGWAWSEAEHGLLVQVKIDGQVVTCARANQWRADLQAAGKGEGRCAFALDLLGDFQVGQVLEVVVLRDDALFLLHGGCVVLGADTCEAASARAHALQTSLADGMPVPLVGVPGVVGFVDHFGRDGLVRGWAYRQGDGAALPPLQFVEQGIPILTVEAVLWRSDLAELRQGDGCCGFEAAVPLQLFDGRLHELDIRIDDGESKSLLSRPFRVRLAKPLATVSSVPAPGNPPALVRQGTPSLRLSVVVVFYNMQREAARTLESLSQTYQRGVDGLAYEVICVDNGSDPPLSQAFIESFGPQFRLWSPADVKASPCAAINEAALSARGEYLAIMIDGAHILTPGVFHEAMAAVDAEPDAMVAVRHWFVGGDQRWLSVAGYSREAEDRLFQRIRWPSDGYRLFHVGAPITESPEPWFDYLNESNCLFLRTATFDAIGGMDENYSVPGGGFANLDLAGRAAEAARDGVICLIGEATFHQYHQGTTTNVCDADKDVQVRAYANQFRYLRGVEFEGIPRDRLRFRGSMRNDDAISVRQRALYPMTLGVTDQVRQGNMPLHFDDGAQKYLQSVYAECDLQSHTQWLGQAVGLAAADLVNLQEIIGQRRPTRIVTTSADAGLLGFLISMLQLHGLHEARIVQVVPAPSADVPAACVQRVVGEPSAPDTLLAVERLLGTELSTLVLFKPDAADELPIDALAAYARFVSFGSWLVFIGTVFGQPWLGYSSRWYLSAIRSFVARHPDFVVDRIWDRQILTACASGYLRRVGGRVTLQTYDAALNQWECTP